jgi:hypothetical protein
MQRRYSPSWFDNGQTARRPGHPASTRATPGTYAILLQKPLFRVLGATLRDCAITGNTRADRVRRQPQLWPALRYSLLIVAIGAPAAIGVPSAIGSSAITPALWAVISFSIFIASMMHSS